MLQRAQRQAELAEQAEQELQQAMPADSPPREEPDSDSDAPRRRGRGSRAVAAPDTLGRPKPKRAPANNTRRMLRDTLCWARSAARGLAHDR